MRRRPRRITGAARGSDYWEIRGLAPSHAVEKKDKSHLGPQGSQARLATACLPQPSAPQLAKDSLGDSRRAACPKTVRDGARGGAGERWWWGLEDHQRPDCCCCCCHMRRWWCCWLMLLHVRRMCCNIVSRSTLLFLMATASYKMFVHCRVNKTTCIRWIRRRCRCHESCCYVWMGWLCFCCCCSYSSKIDSVQRWL